MNCKNLRNRVKKGKPYLYCIIKKRIINYEDCRNCDLKEYKQYKPMKSHTNKLAKKEKERFSIIYPDLTKCCECGLKTGDFDMRINQYTHIDKNEVFEGSYRQVSIRLGMVAPMCTYHHKQFHNDILMNLTYKVMFEKEYLKTHTKEEFIANFGQDYEYKLSKLKNNI